MEDVRDWPFAFTISNATPNEFQRIRTAALLAILEKVKEIDGNELRITVAPHEYHSVPASGR